MGSRMKMAAMAAAMMTIMVGTAETDAAHAQARHRTTRQRVTALERQVRALRAQAAEAQSAADSAMTGVSILFGCIGVLAADSFTLPGTDPTLDQFPLALSSAVVPTYWLAIIDNACLQTPAAAAARS